MKIHYTITAANAVPLHANGTGTCADSAYRAFQPFQGDREDRPDRRRSRHAWRALTVVLLQRFH